MKTIRLATRGSKLALVQANRIKDNLEALSTEENPIHVEILEVLTHGDRDRKNPLSEIGGKGLFVRGIEEELIKGNADIAVHCGKDLPYELQKGLVIAGVPEAGDMRDVLISPKEKPLLLSHENMIEGFEYREFVGQDAPLIGTGSPRRRVELSRQIPNARFAENRGNITTRLRKLKEGQFDGILLAKAGLDRLNMDLSEFDIHVFFPNEFIPAACQGILAIECREEDLEIRELLEKITDPGTLRRFTIERYLFSTLKADCSMAVGAFAQVNAGEETVTVTALYHGKKLSASGEIDQYKEICDDLAERIRGALS